MEAIRNTSKILKDLEILWQTKQIISAETLQDDTSFRNDDAQTEYQALCRHARSELASFSDARYDLEKTIADNEKGELNPDRFDQGARLQSYNQGNEDIRDRILQIQLSIAHHLKCNRIRGRMLEANVARIMKSLIERLGQQPFYYDTYRFHGELFQALNQLEIDHLTSVTDHKIVELYDGAFVEILKKLTTLTALQDIPEHYKDLQIEFLAARNNLTRRDLDPNLDHIRNTIWFLWKDETSFQKLTSSQQSRFLQEIAGLLRLFQNRVAISDTYFPYVQHVRFRALGCTDSTTSKMMLDAVSVFSDLLSDEAFNSVALSKVREDCEKIRKQSTEILNIVGAYSRLPRDPAW